LNADIEPPSISAIRVISTGAKTATIGWQTNEPAASLVEYSFNSGFNKGEIVGNYDLTEEHTVVLPPVLKPATTYYFKVHSIDAAGNQSVSAEESFTTLEDGQITEPPVITNIGAADIGVNSARIYWTTDKNSSSYVEYGQSIAYGKVYGQNEAVLTHSVELSKNLLAGTLYHYRVRSVDAAGNEAISGDNVFTTLAGGEDNEAPQISQIKIEEPSADKVIISWETNEPANSYISFSQDKTYVLRQGNYLMTTHHTITLVGLKPATVYYFRVHSTDVAGNQAINDNGGQGYSFRHGAGDTPPEIPRLKLSM